MSVKEKGIHVTKDEKDRANNVNLVNYLTSIGEPIVSSGRGYYRHKQHDSLVINEQKNFFSWNSQGVSGNAVTYLMNVHNMKFQDAVKKINHDIGHHNVTQFERKEPEYLQEFVYNIKERTRADNVIDYLVNERKIDETLVQQLIQAGFIAEDVYQNVVFKWKENNQIIGTNLQGTRSIPEAKRLRPDREYFKKVLPTTKAATFNGFNITKGIPVNLYFFESPIDLLSYMTIHRDNLKNCRLISMDGLKEQTVIATIKRTQEELKTSGIAIQSITNCVDNDEAGNKFVQKCSGIQYRNIEGKLIDIKGDLPEMPKGEVKWDWNNELKRRVNKVIKKKHDVELEI